MEFGRVKRRVRNYKATADERTSWYGWVCAVSAVVVVVRVQAVFVR